MWAWPTGFLTSGHFSFFILLKMDFSSNFIKKTKEINFLRCLEVPLMASKMIQNRLIETLHLQL